MSFLRALERLGGGRVLQDCEDGLAELVEAVKQTKGDGSLSLKIYVEVNEADEEVVSVRLDGDVMVKSPRHVRGGLICFVREDGGLSTRDPRQPALPGMPAEDHLRPVVAAVDNQRHAAGETA